VDRDTGPEPQAPAASAEAPAAPARRIAPSAQSLRAAVRADPRLSVWIRRIIIALVVGIAIAIWLNWRWGLTAAALVAIADTIYQSKAMAHVPADALATGAQRRTRRQLRGLRSAKWVSLHGRGIPDSDQVIDHLVIGPGGVFAVDSERWDRRLPVRLAGAKAGVLYHGPYSQAPRLQHARWEASRAATLLSAQLKRPVTVSPVMVIYGPKLHWGVATLRGGVQVFDGKGIRKFFKRQNKTTKGSHLSETEIGEIAAAAEQVLPPVR
jgi:Nuclease-related domain